MVKNSGAASLKVQYVLNVRKNILFHGKIVSLIGDLENVLLNAEAIKKPSIRESIIRNADRLRTNYKLIKLEGTVPLPFTIEELPYTYDGITTNEVLKGIGVK